jgi:hypothetical protein
MCVYVCVCEREREKETERERERVCESMTVERSKKWLSHFFIPGCCFLVVGILPTFLQRNIFCS